MSEPLHPPLLLEGSGGESQLLVDRLGDSEELTSLGPLALCGELNSIHSISGLRDFLVRYRETHLVPRELPAIAKAFEFASEYKVRELIELDRAIAEDKAFQPFLTASHHVGRRQLNKLRALQDDRFIQRYRQAVLNGEAKAWHTLVFGLILRTYSIPLRQGLVHYGTQTLRGFIYAAARPLDLTEGACRKLLFENVPALPEAVETVMPKGSIFRSPSN